MGFNVFTHAEVPLEARRGSFRSHDRRSSGRWSPGRWNGGSPGRCHRGLPHGQSEGPPRLAQAIRRRTL